MCYEPMPRLGVNDGTFPSGEVLRQCLGWWMVNDGRIAVGKLQNVQGLADSAVLKWQVLSVDLGIIDLIVVYCRGPLGDTMNLLEYWVSALSRGYDLLIFFQEAEQSTVEYLVLVDLFLTTCAVSRVFGGVGINSAVEIQYQ
ncbi:hypothetical protein U1Q18_018566, partial [Sarracenia purpurea var. burkii]